MDIYTIVKIGQKYVKIVYDNSKIIDWINDFYVYSGCLKISYTEKDNFDFTIVIRKEQIPEINKYNTKNVTICKTVDPKYRSSALSWETYGLKYFYIEKNNIYMKYNESENTVLILYEDVIYSYNSNNYNIIDAFNYIMFPLFYRLFEMQKCILFHAACIALHDKSVVLLGDTASGKTSFAFSMISSDSFDIVSWGRTFLYRMNYNILCHGFPSYENIRVKTMKEYGLSCEKAKNPVNEMDPLSRVTFIPADNPLQCGRKQDVPLKCLFLLKFEPGRQESIIEEVEGDVQFKMIQDCCLSPYDEVYLDWLPIASSPVHIQFINQEKNALIKRLHNYKTYLLKHNGNFNNLKEVIREILA